MHVRGHAKHARLRGLVTWACKRGFTVTSNGAAVLGPKSGANDGAPMGTPVQTDVTIDDQVDLEDDNTQQTGDVPGQMKLEGFFFNAAATTEIYTLSLHDALPI